MNSMVIKSDKESNFISAFNPDTGFYLRSGILKDYEDTGIDPFMAPYPELIDIGIMGSCEHGKSGLCTQAGIQCYQNGLNKQEPNMKLSDFKKIINESKDKVYQVALGGRGDPDQHENFEEIVRYCREHNIVPNYTTSGFGFNNHLASISHDYCGAVAVSWYRSKYTKRTIDTLLRAGVKTNIHYVLSRNTISEAITRLKDKSFPDEINAIIFLLHKPIGLGSQENILQYNDNNLHKFLDIVNTTNFNFKIGFDSCTVPALINLTENIDPMSFDTCEGGRWSMYISPDMQALPCSFDQNHQWAYDLSTSTIEKAWHSPQFRKFRSHFINSCPDCKDQSICMGGCPIVNDIILCDRKERKND